MPYQDKYQFRQSKKHENKRERVMHDIADGKNWSVSATWCIQVSASSQMATLRGFYIVTLQSVGRGHYTSGSLAIVMARQTPKISILAVMAVIIASLRSF